MLSVYSEVKRLLRQWKAENPDSKWLQHDATEEEENEVERNGPENPDDFLLATRSLLRACESNNSKESHCGLQRHLLRLLRDRRDPRVTWEEGTVLRVQVDVGAYRSAAFYFERASDGENERDGIFPLALKRAVEWNYARGGSQCYEGAKSGGCSSVEELVREIDDIIDKCRW